MARRAPAANWIDRLVGYVDPEAGVNRLRARAVMAAAGGYTGARRDRRATDGWNPGGGSADADTLPDLPDLRDRARDLDRNSPLATGAVNTVVTNVVSTGLWPRPAVDREALGLGDADADRFERQAARLFELWAGSPECDITRGQDFPGLQDLALRGVLGSGDVFALPRFVERPGSPFGLKVQMVEADRVSNVDRRRDGVTTADGITLAGGIEVDGNGAPVTYHFTNRHPGDRRAAGLRWTGVPAFTASGRRNVLHLMVRTRPEQTRGVPFLAPVIEPFKQLAKYTDAEIQAAVINACFAIGLKSEEGLGDALQQQLAAAGGGKGAKDAGITISDAGLIFDLGPNESIESFTPGRPTDAFDPFVQAILRQIGAALEIPYELLIRHFTASYSASRAALEMAWQAFRRRRAWLAAGFCQPLYERLLGECIARGWLAAPGFFDDPFVRAAWLGCEWHGDAPISLDPVKDATAAEKWAALGVKTLSEITSQTTGGDWERKLPQRAKEERLRRAAGLVGAPAADATAPVDTPPALPGPGTEEDAP